MCTYNGARFLQEQLESIENQIRLPDEVVICDDGSTDNTAKIVEAFASSAPFSVGFYSNPRNLGSTKNFEKAIGLCTGDIIALADQDDVWFAEKLQRMAEAFSSSDAVGAVFSDAQVVDDELRPLGYTLWEFGGLSESKVMQVARGKALELLLRQDVVTGATFAFLSRFRDRLLPIPEVWVHDGWIALLLACMTEIVPIGEPLMSYRLHAANQIGATRKSLLARLVDLGSVSKSQYIKERIRQFEHAEERIALMSPDNDTGNQLKRIGGKLRHLRWRAAMPANRILRCPWVLLELLKLGYHRYSSGVDVAVKDLLMPA